MLLSKIKEIKNGRVIVKDSKTKDALQEGDRVKSGVDGKVRDAVYPEDFEKYGWQLRQNGRELIATHPKYSVKYKGSPYEIVAKLQRWLIDYNLGKMNSVDDSKTKDDTPSEEAYDRGYAAAKSGLPSSANPYSDVSRSGYGDLKSSWEEGWKEGNTTNDSKTRDRNLVDINQERRRLEDKYEQALRDGDKGLAKTYSDRLEELRKEAIEAENKRDEERKNFGDSKMKDEKVINITTPQWEGDIKIVDGTHFEMKEKGSDRWSWALHIGQADDHILNALKAKGILKDNGRFFNTDAYDPTTPKNIAAAKSLSVAQGKAASDGGPGSGIKGHTTAEEPTQEKPAGKKEAPAVASSSHQAVREKYGWSTSSKESPKELELRDKEKTARKAWLNEEDADHTDRAAARAASLQKFREYNAVIAERKKMRLYRLYESSSDKTPIPEDHAYAKLGKTNASVAAKLANVVLSNNDDFVQEGGNEKSRWGENQVYEAADFLGLPTRGPMMGLVGRKIITEAKRLVKAEQG